MRVGPSLPAVLAVWCGLAAWLVCDFQRLGYYPGDVFLRAAAVAGGALGGTFLGAILQGERVARSRLWTTLVLGVVLPLVGAGIGLGATVAFGSSATSVLEEATFTGLVGGLAAIPGVALTARAAKRADRARPGSVIHEIERRAVWTLPAATLALGTVFAVRRNPYLLRMAHEDPAPALAIAVIATISLIITFAQEISAVRFSSRVAATASELRPREADALESQDAPQIDLGVGKQVLEQIQNGFSYRSAETISLIVRGDPALANAIARRAALRTAVALLVALGSMAVTAALAD